MCFLRFFLSTDTDCCEECERALNTALESKLVPTPPSPANGWLLAGLWSSNYNQSALGEPSIIQHKDICFYFAGLLQKWIQAWQFIETFLNGFLTSKKKCMKLLMVYYNHWHCFKVYNFDWVSLRRRWSSSDKSKNDGSYLCYVVSASILQIIPCNISNTQIKNFNNWQHLTSQQ